MREGGFLFVLLERFNHTCGRFATGSLEEF
jgi:hypothetical protein